MTRTLAVLLLLISLTLFNFCHSISFIISFGSYFVPRDTQKHSYALGLSNLDLLTNSQTIYQRYCVFAWLRSKFYIFYWNMWNQQSMCSLTITSGKRNFESANIRFKRDPSPSFFTNLVAFFFLQVTLGLNLSKSISQSLYITCTNHYSELTLILIHDEKTGL